MMRLERGSLEEPSCKKDEETNEQIPGFGVGKRRGKTARKSPFHDDKVDYLFFFVSILVLSWKGTL